MTSEYNNTNPSMAHRYFDMDLCSHIRIIENGYEDVEKDRKKGLQAIVNPLFLEYLKENANLRFIEVLKDERGILGYYTYRGVQLTEFDEENFPDQYWYYIRPLPKLSELSSTDPGIF